VYANLYGRGGIVASVSFDQSWCGALYQFEQVYLQYHLRGGRGRCARLKSAVGVDVSQFYRRCRQLGVPVRAGA
jgi:hypothetical protein